MRTIPREDMLRSDSSLKNLDDTIREAIGGLNRSQAGDLVALFVTGEQEEALRVLFADKLARSGHGALKRLDDSLGQSETIAAHAELEPALKD